MLGMLTSRLLLPAFLCLLVSACGSDPAALHIEGPTMGTRYHITWISNSGSTGQEELAVAVAGMLAGINNSMSTYEEDSTISVFNRAPVGQWIAVDEDFVEVLTAAREVGGLSQGAYDVTVAPLVNLWGFGPQRGQQVPSRENIQRALTQVREGLLEYDPEARAIRKQSPLQLDFSSVAKGYAVDKIADWMSGEGVKDYLVEVGGEIRVAGLSPRGEPWRIAVEKPAAGERDVQVVLTVTDVAVATSGDYRNFFEHEGVRYSHSIDPRTGWPVRHELVSVTVVHPRAALADAWATALTVLGPEQALATAVEQGLAVYLVSHTDSGLQVQKTPAMESWLQ